MNINPGTAFKKLQLPYPNRGIIGHRGLSSLAPENTRASFISAANAGLSWVEFDIQRCDSGEWVVFHDKTLERTSNGRGTVQDMSLAELKRLDLGSWFDRRFANEHILSLAEVLPLLSQLGLHPNIEVKFFEDTPIDMAKAAADIGSIVHQYWIAQAHAPAVISSFYDDFLLAFRDRYPDWPIAYLVEQFQEQHINTVREGRFNMLNAEKDSLLTYIQRQRLHTDIPILAFTVNDAPTAKRLFSAGISAIFSDKAEL